MGWVPRLYLRRVSGASMLPALRPGQLVVAYRKHYPYRPGEIVLLSHDGLDKIKRLGDTRPGEVFIIGDNAGASTDSRQFGWLPATLILGKIITPRQYIAGRRSTSP